MTSATAFPAATARPRPTVRPRRPAARLILLALVCLLHAVFLYSWRGEFALMAPPVVAYIQLRNLAPQPAAPPVADKPMPSRSPARAPRLDQPAVAPARPRQATDEAVTPDAPPATPPGQSGEAPLDLERLHDSARAYERSRVRSPLERLHERERADHPPRSIEARVAEAATRTARKDCQTGYAGYGLFAALPLIYGTVADDGCKWK